MSTPINSSSSTSANSATLNSLGVGSGLDMNTILSAVMSVQQAPIKQLDNQEIQLQAQLSALGLVKSSVSDFQTSSGTLRLASIIPVYTATTTDSSSLTASVTGVPKLTSYSIKVTQLAQNQQLVATGQASKTASIGTGVATTVSIDFGAISGTLNSTTGKYTGAIFTPDTNQATVTFSLDSSNNTLSGIKDAINNANIGITADIINDGSGTPYRLTLSNQKTGENSNLRISVAGDATISSLLSYDVENTQNLSQTQAGQSANLTINSIAVKSETNTVNDSISGLSLNLLNTTSGTTLTVGNDTSGIQSGLADLVSKFNSLNSSLATNTGYKQILQGNIGLQQLSSKMNSLLNSPQAGSTKYKTFASIGISFDGTTNLSLNSSTLAAALKADSIGVSKMINAYATSFNQLTTDALGSDGQITSQTNAINSQVTDIGNKRIALNAQLETIKNNLQQQYAKLDSVIAKFNQTMSYLTQQFNAFSNAQNSNN